MCAQDTSVREHPGSHEDRTGQESRTTTPFVQPDQSRDSHEHVDDVANGRG